MSDSSREPADLLFELGEELRRHQQQGETIQFDALASRFGVDEADVRDCMAALQALEQACGEDLPPGPEAPAALEPPELPDDYELLQELGAGGMGVVYRARQRSLDRTVAVKVLRPGDRRFGDMLHRFEREARTLARLSHPHVVPIHEVGRVGDNVFFSMALIEGTSLSELLSREQLNPARAATVLEQVSDAVAYVHTQGVVHRDLKPANVLLDEAGSAYVVDFGLAVELGAEGLTATGHVVGTPAYMSPEQARADRERVGEASDVYALGAILFECLTGEPPFRRPSLGETLHAVIHDAPPRPRGLNPKVPLELEAVVLKALAKEPELRYPSAAALREDLRRFAQGEPVQARLPSGWVRARAWSRRNPGRALALAQLALVGLCALGWGCVELVRWRLDVAETRSRRAEEFAAKQAQARRELGRAVEPRAAQGDLRARTELAWSHAVGWAYDQDLDRGLDELAALAKAGHASAVVGYVFLLERGYRVTPYDPERNHGWSDPWNLADERPLGEREPDLWARERARIQAGVEAGEGWASWVRGELTRSPQAAAHERADDRPRLLELDPEQAPLDLVAAVSSPEFAFSWRDPWADSGHGESTYGGLYVHGPFAQGSWIALRNPALVLKQTLIDEPQRAPDLLARLEVACDAGSVGAAATLLRCLSQTGATEEVLHRPQLYAKALVRALELGAAVVPLTGLASPECRSAAHAALVASAERGGWRAMLLLASNLAGEGSLELPRDEALAEQWRGRAAQRVRERADTGDPQAMRQLAAWLRYGDAAFAVERDEAAADRWRAQAKAAEAAEARGSK